MDKLELLEALAELGEGLHIIRDDKDRIYQGIVKEGKVIFYVTSVGVVYQNETTAWKDKFAEYKEIGWLSDPNHFKVIAEFNRWI